MPEERKLVTVLFADIVGSTALGSQNDPELVRSTLGAAFAHMRSILLAHGGTVEKFIGDAVVAVFGVPATHDDDAERAIRAAFAIRERVSEGYSDGPLRLALRIGVNSGEAVTGGGEGGELLVTGEPANGAARMQQAASPGEILAGALTRRLTARTLTYGAERTIEAKGLGSLSVAPAESATTAVPEQRRGLHGARAPLIGRDEELALLREAHARVERERHPQLVTILGHAGTGKSRLAQEFVATLDPQSVLYGRCLPYGEGIAFYAVQQMLRADAEITRADPQDAAERKLRTRVAAALGESADEIDLIARRLAVLAGVGDGAHLLPEIAPEDLAEELRWAFRRYVERRASARPLTIVVEDIHWASTTLLDLVENVVDWAREGILVLCLARPELLDERPSWGAGRTNVATVVLEPLSSDETRRLIAALLEVDRMEEDLRDEVMARAEGNPLYVEELLQALVETGRIVRREDRWEAVAGAPLELPPTLQGVIAARLDRVPPEVKRTIQRGAVVGRVFSAASLVALEDEGATARLREAIRRDLVQQVDEGPRGRGGVYRFKHVLVRDVAYASLPKGDRAAAHDRYARWVEATAGEKREDIAELAAHHTDQAFELAREIHGRETRELGRRAIERLLVAARRAQDRGDTRAARALWMRILVVGDVVGLSAEERLEAEARAALLLESDLQIKAAVSVALQKARSAEPSGLLVELLVAAGVLESGSSLERTRELFDEALQTAAAVGDAEVITNARLADVMYFRVSADIAEARRRCEETLGFAKERGAPRGVMRCFIHLQYLEHLDARFSHSMRRFEEAERLATEAGALGSQLTLLAQQARNASFAGQSALALRFAEKMRRLAEKIGSRAALSSERALLGLAHYEAGDLQASGVALTEAVDLADRTDVVTFYWKSLLLVRTLVALGDLAKSRKLLDDLAGGTVAWVYWRTFRPTVAATLYAAEGDFRKADDQFREALAASPAHRVFRAHALLEYGRFLVRRRRPADAIPVLQEARAFYADPLAAPRQREIDELLRQCREMVAAV